MNILICTETYHPYTSGVVTHIETLKACLEQQGHRVLVAAAVAGLKEQEERDGVLYCPGVELKKIYGYGLALPYSLQRLEAVRRFAPDLVHIHTEFTMGMFGQWAAACLNIPVVYTTHTFYDDYVGYVVGEAGEEAARRMMRRYVARFSRRADAVIAPAEKIAAYLRAADCEATPAIVPNTVQADDFAPTAADPAAVEALKVRLGIGPQDTCLCYVGRLGEEKRVRELVSMFIEGFKGMPEYKLFLLGDGPERQPLLGLVADAGIQGQVFLPGRIPHEQLPVWYGCFSLYTTASLSEVHSISLIEAQVAGLYAVNQLDEANRHQITEGETGEYFTTSADFAAAVRRYAALPAGQRQAQRFAISQTARAYGPPQFTARILDVYRQAAAVHAAGALSAAVPAEEPDSRQAA